MSLSVSDITALVERVRALLLGARLQRVRRRAWPAGVLLALRQPGATHHLLLQAWSPHARIQLAPPEAESAHADAFVMALRSHLEGMRLCEVDLWGGDRVVALGWGAPAAPPETENPSPERHVLRWLVAELTGARGALFLLDEERNIVALVGRPLGRTAPTRPGSPYALPDPSVSPQTSRTSGAGTLDERLAHEATQEALAYVATQRAALLQPLRRQRQRLQRRLDALRRDLHAADDAPRLRQSADLLQAQRQLYTPGAEHVVVQDWYAGPGATRHLRLRPDRTLSENVDLLYREARRRERGAEHARTRLVSTEAGLRALDATIEAIEAAGPLEIADRASQARSAQPLGAGLGKRADRRGPTQQPRRLPYRTFRASDGSLVFVGRGGRDNDTLTFHVAKGNDWWLHTEDHAGSHVVVRPPAGQALSSSALEEAALLAAHHSKARKEGVVAVRYTQRKHVRKPKGMAPGRVILAAAKSVDVRLDDPRLRKLLTSDDAGER